MNDKHQYVDLGLSVNWATCNIDAERPEEYGGLYAWGEIKTKKNYSWHKYKYNKLRFIHGIEISKYWVLFRKKIAILEPSDDVANVKWGGDWRMPTEEEFEELRKNCTWIWSEINGIKGYKVISNKTGYSDRFIFLPASGYCGDKYWCGVGVEGNYWSSSVNTEYNRQAFYLHFDKEGGHTEVCRNAGLTVRPVRPSNTWNIKIKERYIIIKENDIYKLNIEDIDNTIIDWFKIKWSSDNSYVAIVDDYGRVSGISIGDAIITAMVKNRIVYCHVEVVETKREKGKKPNYVDLGLSVKWASCNLGASMPEAYGDYYAWGEIKTKPSYSIANYKFRKSGSSVEEIKYYKYNKSDNKKILDLDDDVAHIKWGGKWRIPTKEEWVELCFECEWVACTLNGVEGFKVTSKKPGYSDRSIFLPKNGYYQNKELVEVNITGNYWSSTPLNNVGIQYSAYIFNLQYEFFHYEEKKYRHYGLSIRPVCQ